MGISQLPDEFKDFVGPYVGAGGHTDSFLRYCLSEVFHAQWALILDNDFVSTYKHGIVVECLDQVMQRFYPRIFTYSVDYPEK